MICIGRRTFLAALGSAAAAWPFATLAQQPMRRISVLMGNAATDMNAQSYAAAFVQGLKQLGWIEGQNVRIDIRWSTSEALAKIYAAQLIGLQPDVIFSDTTANLMALREATSSVPIVFIRVSDPVEQGFAASLTKPGGNATGFSAYNFSIGGKWLDLLKEAAPQLGRAGIVFDPDTSPQTKFFMRAIEAAASTLGTQVVAVPVRTDAELEPTLTNFAQQPNGGLILPTDTFVRLHLKPIADLASRLRLPSICYDSEFPKLGGLMSYSSDVNYAEQSREASGYVDRILKGAKAGDLPIQGPDRYKVVINLKTAKALGLTIPLSLSGLADEVIE
jgi:putative tryptophan/tyrosine transport system substrate-binding protein